MPRSVPMTYCHLWGITNYVCLRTCFSRWHTRRTSNRARHPRLRVCSRNSARQQVNVGCKKAVGEKVRRITIDGLAVDIDKDTGYMVDRVRTLAVVRVIRHCTKLQVNPPAFDLERSVRTAFVHFEPYSRVVPKQLVSSKVVANTLLSPANAKLRQPSNSNAGRRTSVRGQPLFESLATARPTCPSLISRSRLRRHCGDQVRPSSSG